MTDSKEGELQDKSGSVQPSDTGVPKNKDGSPAAGVADPSTVEELQTQLDKAVAQNVADQQMIGKQAGQIGELSSTKVLYESMLQEGRPQDTVTEPKKEEEIPFDFSNPVKSIKDLVHTEVADRDQERDKGLANAYFQEGMSVAIKESPHLFKDSDHTNKVAGMMAAGFKSGVIKDVNQLRNPDTWRYASVMLDARESGFKSNTKESGMAVVQTDVPANATTDPTLSKVNKKFNENDFALMKGFGRTEEEAIKLMDEAEKRGDFN